MVSTKTFIATAFAAVALLSSHTVDAAPVTAAAKSGQTGAILNGSKFCFFLPPMMGGGIAENEDKAIAFCSAKIATAPNAKLFPTGFIQSAHFIENKTKGYVQVTGRMDGSKYKLKSTDGGGQYDIKAPVGSKCAGYNHYVNLVEPNLNIYCIRCCKNKIDCPTGKSTYGCKKVIGGDYS